MVAAREPAAAAAANERTSLLATSAADKWNYFRLDVARLARLITFASSFSDGWDLGIFAIILVPMRNEFALTATQVGFLASIPSLVGVVVGSLCAGCVMDSIGRKPTIGASYLICMIGCLVQAMSPGLIVFGIGRTVLCLGVRAGLSCTSIYMAELSPACTRGAMASLEEIYISIGILAATLSAWILIGLDLVSWRVFVAIGALAPALAGTCLLLLGVPESPRYLQLKGKHDEALVVLREALYGDEEELSRTLDHWKLEESANGSRTWKELWQEVVIIVSHRGFRIAVSCWMARVGSGMVIIGTYLTLFLSDLGEEAYLRWFAIGQVLKTLAVIPVVGLIDYYGRRVMFLLSAALCGLSMLAALIFKAYDFPLILIAWCFIAYFTAFSLGYGPVCWAYCFEILPGDRRGMAGALSMIPGDLLGFIVQSSGPVLLGINPALPFLVLVITNFSAMVFFWAACPETKGLLLEIAKDVSDFSNEART